jgi:Flp pilus assembly CpaF family ATPase
MAVRIPGIDLQEYYAQLGPIQPVIEDDRVTEVMVNGIDHVYVEMGGKVVLTGIKFQDEDQLLNVIQFIVRSVGRRIDERTPLAASPTGPASMPSSGRWPSTVRC